MWFNVKSSGSKSSRDPCNLALKSAMYPRAMRPVSLALQSVPVSFQPWQPKAGGIFNK